MGDGNQRGGSSATKAVRSIPIQDMPPVLGGYAVALYWNKDRELMLRVNDTEISLHPWVGVYLEANPHRDWHRDELGKYEPNELANYLRKIGG
jgi:hypothetical protein